MFVYRYNMEKITPKKISNWSAWIIKAKGLKDKYEHLKCELLDELKRNKPPLFSKYNHKQSLILLLLLSKVVKSQEILYRRFINGSKIFLSNIKDEENKEYLDLLESVYQEGKLFLKNIEKEKKYLNDISDFLKMINEKQLITILNSGKLNEKKIEEIRKKIEFISKYEIKKIKMIHKNILKQNHKEKKVSINLNLKIENMKIANHKLFLLMKNDKITKGAGLVYIGGYICFFAGILDYQAFNEITNLARRTIALGTDSASLVF